MTLTLSPESVREFAKLVAEELVALQPAAKPNTLLTCRQAALELSLSHETVRQLVKGGHLKRQKGIRQIRISQSSLDAYRSTAE